jgi:hypothetical protein
VAKFHIIAERQNIVSWYFQLLQGDLLASKAAFVGKWQLKAASRFSGIENPVLGAASAFQSLLLTDLFEVIFDLERTLKEF